MSPAIHLCAKNFPVYRESESRYLACSGVSVRAVTRLTTSPCFTLVVNRHVKIGFWKSSSKGTSLVCKASSGASGGQRRNPDFSRQNRHGFSWSRNRQNEERESFGNLEESEPSSSKNGPLLFLPITPKFQATAAPGPTEREIVELFRKVQAQLRERAAIKEERKFEAQKGHGKESENVNSLLNLLRKHSNEQVKRRSNDSSRRDFSLDQPEQNGAFDEHKRTSRLGSNSNPGPGVQEPNSSSLTRPLSNFQRRSPVPQQKYQPIYSGEDTVNSEWLSSSTWKRKKDQIQTHTEHESEPGPELGPEPVAELEPVPVPEQEEETELNFPDGYVFNESSGGESSDIEDINNDEDGDKELTEHRDLSALKLTELRALAKSQGMKGFSKMKKSELMELLSGSLV